MTHRPSLGLDKQKRTGYLQSMKCSIFIAASLDGFIARTDGSVDWLDVADHSGGEDHGYKAFVDTVDVLVMGRNSFDKVLTFGEWPYADQRVAVLTHRALTVPKGAEETVEAVAGTPLEVIDQLAARGARHLYIDGGETIQQFLRAGLIQQLVITTIPVLLGSGIPLFGPLGADIKLTLVACKSYPDGLVQTRYEVTGPS